jgi:predicted DNA-binding transcriptional regulator YafY
MNRVSRLFHIHEALSRSEPPLDAAAWGVIFGVNVRTVLRDMAFLKKELGAPVIFDPHSRGYKYEWTKCPPTQIPSRIEHRMHHSQSIPCRSNMLDIPHSRRCSDSGAPMPEFATAFTSGDTKKELMPETKANKWTRLLTLIHRICAEPGKTAKELAKATGRTERTIFRDMQDLEKAGFPIYNDNGYRFAADAFLPNIGLAPTELFSLFVAVRLLESQDDAELGAEARRALEKILRATTEQKRPDLGNLRDSIHVTEVTEETGAGLLASMQEALSSGRQLEIEYRGMNDEQAKKRLLDPMGLFCFRQVWYLHGYDHDRQALRNFRLSRVSRAQLHNEPVRFEAKMELHDASYHKWDVEGEEKTEVRIRITPSLARWLGENSAHPSQGINGDEVRYEVSNPVAMTRWVTSLYGLEVLEPRELRDELGRVSRELVELYGGGEE